MVGCPLMAAKMTPTPPAPLPGIPAVLPTEVDTGDILTYFGVAALLITGSLVFAAVARLLNHRRKEVTP